MKTLNRVKFENRVVFVICIPLLLLVYGCSGVKTADVSRFATLSAQAGEKFPALVADIPESCVRRSQYESMRNNQFDPDKLLTKAEQQCATFTELEPRIVGANRVLLNYMNAMSKLASNEVATYDKSLDAFAASLTATEKFKKQEVDAVKGIVNFLSNALANEWRRKKLNTAIQTSNTNVQVLAQSLIVIVKNDYKQNLDSEEEAAKKFYLGNIKDHMAKEPLSVILVQERWEQERKAILNKKKATDAYVTILTNIAQGHQKLNDNKLSSSEVRQMILQYISTVEPLINDLRKAF